MTLIGYRAAVAVADAAARRRESGHLRHAVWLQRLALRLAEVSLPPRDRRLIRFLNDLGVACKFTGRFDRAAAVYGRALAIATATPDIDGHTVATLHHNVGGLEHARGRPADGEPAARHGLRLRESLVGPDDPSVAVDLVALAALVDAQGRLDEAEVLYRRALRIWSQQAEPDQVEVAVAIGNLAAIEHRRGDLIAAEASYRAALELREKAIGRDHPDLAPTLNNLGLLLNDTGHVVEAAACYRRALAVAERELRRGHPTIAACRQNLERLGPQLILTESPSDERPAAIGSCP